MKLEPFTSGHFLLKGLFLPRPPAQDLRACRLFSSPLCTLAFSTSSQSLPSRPEPHCGAVPTSQSPSPVTTVPWERRRGRQAPPSPGRRRPLLAQALRRVRKLECPECCRCKMRQVGRKWRIACKSVSISSAKPRVSRRVIPEIGVCFKSVWTC